MGETQGTGPGFGDSTTMPSSSTPEQPKQRPHAAIQRLNYKNLPQGSFGERSYDFYATLKKFQNLDAPANLDNAFGSVKQTQNLKFQSLKGRHSDSSKKRPDVRQIVFDLGENPETKTSTKMYFLDPEGLLEKDLQAVENNPNEDLERTKRQTRFFTHVIEEISKGNIAVQTKKEDGETELITTKDHIDDIITREGKKITIRECNNEDMKMLAFIAGETLGIKIVITAETELQEHFEVQEESTEETHKAKIHEKGLPVKPAPLTKTERSITDQEKGKSPEEILAAKREKARQYAKHREQERASLKAEAERDVIALEKKERSLNTDIVKSELRKTQERLQHKADDIHKKKKK